MKKIIGVITARVTSTRLPGKVLLDIAGKSNFAHHVERMKAIPELSSIFLATSANVLNEPLIKEAERLNCGWYAGAEEDIVERHISLCSREKADAVIRVTCDCPLFDIDSASLFIKEFRKEYRDFIYVSNMAMTYGTFSELISFDALREVHKNYRGPAVSLPIRENMGSFKTLGVAVGEELCRPEYRLTVDYPEDLELVRHIYNALYRGKPLALHDVYVWLDDNPQTARINAHVAVKGVNVYAANLMEKPLYSVVRSGDRYLILDEQKRSLTPSEFLAKLAELFPGRMT